MPSKAMCAAVLALVAVGLACSSDKPNPHRVKYGLGGADEAAVQAQVAAVYNAFLDRPSLETAKRAGAALTLLSYKAGLKLPDFKIIPYLVRMATDERVDMRDGALSMLGAFILAQQKLPEQDRATVAAGVEEAVKTCLAGLKDVDPVVRLAAVDGLKGLHRLELIEVGIGLLKDEYAQVRLRGVLLLGELTDLDAARRVPPALQPLLKDQDKEVRDAAKVVLRWYERTTAPELGQEPK